ncbi:MAG TPA: hypothetical protein VI546_03710, partial [candidate division Zixibacteria bacterium]|nr:hypothetical protein [candidate division Zixibacteria bacterium]
SFSKKPLLFFGSWGLVLIALGITVGLVAIGFRVFAHEGYRPVLYLVMLLELLGISFFALGFLGETLVELLSRMDNLAREVGELKNRPAHGAPHPHHQNQPHERPSPTPAQPREVEVSETPAPEESEPKFPFDR